MFSDVATSRCPCPDLELSNVCETFEVVAQGMVLDHLSPRRRQPVRIVGGGARRPMRGFDHPSTNCNPSAVRSPPSPGRRTWSRSRLHRPTDASVSVEQLRVRLDRLNLDPAAVARFWPGFGLVSEDPKGAKSSGTVLSTSGSTGLASVRECHVMLSASDTQQQPTKESLGERRNEIMAAAKRHAGSNIHSHCSPERSGRMSQRRDHG